MFGLTGSWSATAKIHSRLEAIDLRKGILKVTNRYLFTNLAEYELIWEITRNGIVIASGTDICEAEPLSAKEISLSCKQSDWSANEPGEYLLNVSLILKEDRPWAEKEHEIAFEQFVLAGVVSADTAARQAASELQFTENERLPAKAGRFLLRLKAADTG